MKIEAEHFNPLYLEQIETPRYQGLWRLPLVFSIFVLGLIGASAFVRLDIVSSARGALLPSEQAASRMPASTLPPGKAFVFEASMDNKDIGFLKIGQPVRVKIDAFPSTRYGLLWGELVSLELDETFAKDPAMKRILTTQPVPYRATIKIKETKLSKMDGSVELREGMSGSADIVTGSRTLLSYFLDPVTEAFQKGLSEQ